MSDREFAIQNLSHLSSGQLFHKACKWNDDLAAELCLARQGDQMPGVSLARLYWMFQSGAGELALKHLLKKPAEHCFELVKIMHLSGNPDHVRKAGLAMRDTALDIFSQFDQRVCGQCPERANGCDWLSCPHTVRD